MELKVGGDPEFFLVNGDRVIASCGLVGGTKKNPLMVAEGVGVLEDGVAVEINYDPKVWEPGSHEAFNFAANARDRVEEFLARKNSKYRLINAPENQFEPKDLVHPNAKTFGCDPDFNAWTGAPNIPPKLSEIGNYRFAGGHLHFGYDKEKCKIPVPCLVQFLDGLVTCVLVSQSRNAIGPLRRKFYGRAGSFRDKPYGFEYRVLSPFWMGDMGTFNRIVGTVHWLINNQDEAFGVYQKIEALAASIQNRIAGIANDPTIDTLLDEHRDRISEYTFPQAREVNLAVTAGGILGRQGVANRQRNVLFGNANPPRGLDMPPMPPGDVTIGQVEARLRTPAEEAAQHDLDRLRQIHRLRMQEMADQAQQWAIPVIEEEEEDGDEEEFQEDHIDVGGEQAF